MATATAIPTYEYMNGNGFLSPARAQILEDPEDYPQICIQPVRSDGRTLGTMACGTASMNCEGGMSPKVQISEA